MQGCGSTKDLSSEVGGLASRLPSDLSCNRSLWLYIDTDWRSDGQGDQQRMKSGLADRNDQIPDHRELEASGVPASQLVPACTAACSLGAHYRVKNSLGKLLVFLSFLEKKAAGHLPGISACRKLKQEN